MGRKNMPKSSLEARFTQGSSPKHPSFEGIQWIANSRKTKGASEERALHEKLTRILRDLKEMILKDGDAEEWKRRAWSFGEAMEDLLWFPDTVDTGVDIAD